MTSARAATPPDASEPAPGAPGAPGILDRRDAAIAAALALLPALLYFRTAPAVVNMDGLGYIKLLPHNFASYPCRRFDTSAGQCRPGDPVPYIVYPPEFTGTGLLAEVGAVALLFWAIP